MALLPAKSDRLDEAARGYERGFALTSKDQRKEGAYLVVVCTKFRDRAAVDATLEIRRVLAEMAPARYGVHLDRSVFHDETDAERGFYRDDTETYGMLNYQAWRAARLVVDTGLHAMGWDRERAMQFFRDHLSFGETDIANEIDRYINWPGQSLAYMVGCLEITDIRREVEARQGSRFDLADFHDRLLENGALPLPALRRMILREFAF